tara:strand:+ start:318 stop:650 length:333 start_codon:yes stop_codon:yes gene_type:complete
MTLRSQLEKAHWHNQQIIELIQGNEWEKALMDSLTSTRVELERQINNLPPEEPLYRIEDEKTSGWSTIDDQLVNGVQQYRRLTKAVCSERLNALIEEGYNPERLRIRRDN